MKKTKYAKEDETLKTLLNLDGQSYVTDDHFRIEISVKKVKVTQNRPYGIKYRLALIAPDGTRLIGYENHQKHKIKTKRKNMVLKR